jgi:ABC-type multidrug transport system fused ATPase/permease subunit
MTDTDHTREAPAQGRLGRLTNVWKLLSLARPPQRRSLILAIACGVMASLADIASLALLKPALGAVGVNSADAARTSLAMFIIAAMVASIFRLMAIRQTVSAQYGMASTLAVDSFERLQKQDYSAFLKDGASLGFAAFDRLYMLTFQVLAPTIAAMTAACSILVLLAGLSVIEPWAGLFFAVLVAAVVGAMGHWRGARATKGLSPLANLRSRILFESRSGFRDIFLTNGQDRLVSDFAAIDRELCDRQGAGVIAAQSARHTLELAGFAVALAGLGAMSLSGAGGAGMVPALGILALAGFRLLPHLATLRSAAQMIANHGEVTRDVLALLFADLPASVRGGSHIPSGPIRLQKVTVRREGRPDPLRDLSLDIPKGARIGVSGGSGAGKSTLLDVLAGAIIPDAGTVLIGGAPLDRASGLAWRERIGFVSQNPLLLGGNLRDAVVFPDRPAEVDPARFDEAVRLAGVDTMAAQFAEGLDTPVGEVVEQLSGGQRQRLALAHALYRARDLLLLDEATGQLDTASELELIATIEALPHDLTIVLVSHRPAMFRCCDTVYELRQGKLHEVAPPKGAKLAQRRKPVSVSD